MNILLWVGAIASVITAIAYIIVMVVFVVGIESALAMNQLLVVAIIGAVAGLSITWMLKMQGVALAANEEESKRIMKAYNDVKYAKDKKPRYRTIAQYYIVSGIMDITVKGVSVAASTYFGYSIFAEGNGDMALIGFAFVNVLMFLSFGILALSKAYKVYMTDHLAAIVEKTKRLKKLDELASIPVEEEINEAQ